MGQPKLCTTRIVYIYENRKYREIQDLLEVLRNECYIFDFRDWLNENYSADEVFDLLLEYATNYSLSYEEINTVFDDEYEHYIYNIIEKLVNDNVILTCEVVDRVIEEN